MFKNIVFFYGVSGPSAMFHKKTKGVQQKYTWAYSWTWRHNAALLQTVTPALPQALWHASVEKRKKLEEWMPPWYDSDGWKSKISNVFFDPWREKSSHCTGKTHIFTLESHACQSKWMSMLQTFLTTPANTSILSLALKNQNFKFVTLTRAPSQPVALFIIFPIGRRKSSASSARSSRCQSQMGPGVGSPNLHENGQFLLLYSNTHSICQICPDCQISPFSRQIPFTSIYPISTTRHFPHFFLAIHQLTSESHQRFPITVTGWWYTYPSEKYEFVSWDDDIPNWMESQKNPWFQSPPARSTIIYQLYPHIFDGKTLYIISLKWNFPHFPG